jgi:glycine/D-amino acid oxidase-like deaminating enzyme
MRAELSRLGISVTVVEPGSFLDGSSLQVTAAEIADYAGTAERVRHAASANNGGQINDPARGADAIHEVVEAEKLW